MLGLESEEFAATTVSNWFVVPSSRACTVPFLPVVLQVFWHVLPGVLPTVVPGAALQKPGLNQGIHRHDTRVTDAAPRVV